MIRLLTAAVLASLFALSAAAENWPQWRGPKNDGHSSETGLPIEWGAPVVTVKPGTRKTAPVLKFESEPKNIVWQFKMPGPGESTPCIWEDRIFLTTTAGNTELLLCVGTDGQEKWRQTLSNTGESRFGPDQATDASPSCSTDGKHVWSYIGGRTGKLFCHDLDGKPVWEKDLQEYGKFNIQFGTHWTPALYKGKLYLQVMHRSAQKVVCLDGATGKEVWAVDRRGAVEARPVPQRSPESPDVYASAVIWEGEGGPLLIAHGNDYCTAHKLEDGSEVWRVEGLNPSNSRAWRFVSSPLATPDLIVVPSCKNGPTVGLNPVGAQGSISPGHPAELWRINVTPDVVSPIRVGDIVYLCSDGPLTAVDAKTGKELFRAPRERQIHRANMVAADGKIYIVGRDGKADVIAAGPEFKRLATNTLPDKIMASPAISGGRIYLRGYETLWAIGTK